MNTKITLNDKLIFSCRSGNIALTRERIEAGADVNHQNSDGAAPILAAIKKESLSTVSYLIEQGVNLNCTDNYENTPLEYAIEFNNKEIAELLFNNGAYLGNKTSLHAKEWLVTFRKSIIGPYTKKE